MTELQIINPVEVRVRKSEGREIDYHGILFWRFHFNPLCPFCLRENHITLDFIAMARPVDENLPEEMDFMLHPAYKTCTHYHYHYSDHDQHPAEAQISCRTVFMEK